MFPHSKHIFKYIGLQNMTKPRKRNKTKMNYKPWSLQLFIMSFHLFGDQSYFLTHWGRVMHICVSKLTIIDSDNGLSPGRRQAIIWTNAGILLIQTLGTNFSEILSEIHTFSFKKIHLKMSSGKTGHFVSASIWQKMSIVLLFLQNDTEHKQLWLLIDIIYFSHIFFGMTSHKANQPFILGKPALTILAL